MARIRVDNRKCSQCGLISFAHSVECRRCAALLTGDGATVESPGQAPTRARRLLGLAAVIGILLFLCRVSLLLTSDALSRDQQQAVGRAIARLEENQFTREVAVLRHVTSFRASDNWWNQFVGHGQAYAATNFPFQVVTLYPRFFDVAVDDNERAIILLHESRHLFGRGEEAALEDVWRAKVRLGWSAHAYGHTRVWKNTREWTQGSVPHLFTCGADGQSDCVE
jgi:hypothetical protein